MSEEVCVHELGEALGAFRLCDTRELARIQQSLVRLGQLHPILAYRAADKLQVIDGLKRLRGARNLSWTHVRVAVLAVKVVGAKLCLWQSNLGHGMSEIEEAWLVRSLYRQDGLTQVEIGQLFGRHQSWANRRLLMAEELCDELQADVRLGLLSATSARELIRLPRGHQCDVERVVLRRGLTTRQTTRLVDDVLAAADDKTRAELLAQTLGAPWASPPAERERGRAKRTPSEWIVSDLEVLTRTSARLQARLLARPLASYGPGAAETLARELSLLVRVLESALRVVGDVLGHWEEACASR
jgi:ParB-like chromosome segregation protein Spo0J